MKISKCWWQHLYI